MNKLKEAFWQDYLDADNIWKKSEVGSEDYKRWMEEKEKIRKSFIYI